MPTSEAFHSSCFTCECVYINCPYKHYLDGEFSKWCPWAGRAYCVVAKDAFFEKVVHGDLISYDAVIGPGRFMLVEQLDHKSNLFALWYSSYFLTYSNAFTVKCSLPPHLLTTEFKRKMRKIHGKAIDVTFCATPLTVEEQVGLHHKNIQFDMRCTLPVLVSLIKCMGFPCDICRIIANFVLFGHLSVARELKRIKL